MTRHEDGAADARYGVVHPLGRLRVQQREASERLNDLSGKTIAFIWDYLFKGDQMFSILQEHLAARYPGVRFVGPEVFGNVHGSAAEERQSLAALPSRLRAHKVDAAVVAVGA
jgi:hypothetical protein